jgi:hypothetical protein
MRRRMVLYCHGHAQRVCLLVLIEPHAALPYLLSLSCPVRLFTLISSVPPTTDTLVTPLCVCNSTQCNACGSLASRALV